MKTFLLFFPMLFLAPGILFNPLFVLSKEVSNVYLLYPSSFSQVDIDKFKNFGYEKNRVGIKNTMLLRPSNTNYYILCLTTKTNTENMAIRSALDTGKLFKIGERQFYGYYDSRWGGVREYITSDFLPVLPKEFLEPWKVEQSTP